MNLTHYYEERDAWFARADRFDGFDRGDLDSGVDYGMAMTPEEWAEAEAYEKFLASFVGPMPAPTVVELDEFDDIPF